MATFSKDQVKNCGSLAGFARWAECYKVYELENKYNFVAIRSERDEQALFGSRYCQGAKLVWEQGRNIEYDWDSLFIEVAIFYGETEELANKEVQNSGISKDKIISIETSKGVKERISTGTGTTREEAIRDAEYRIPKIAFNLKSPFVVDGKTGCVEMKGFSETEIRSNWKTKVDNNAGACELQKIECITPPKKYLFVIKKEGLWRIYWSSPFEANIFYNMPVELLVRYSSL